MYIVFQKFVYWKLFHRLAFNWKIGNFNLSMVYILIWWCSAEVQVWVAASKQTIELYEKVSSRAKGAALPDPSVV